MPGTDLLRVITVIALLIVSTSIATADDIDGAAGSWPTYAADNARSGVTTQTVSLPLVPSWRFVSRARPQLAWPGPAKLDGYNKVYGLADRMTFDRAFQVIAAQGCIYFGSSVDDKVYCLDLATGTERWSFFTEGPVRLAPTYWDDHIYVGSDDGYVYCLQADDGALSWKCRLGPSDHRVPGNGSLVSLWAIRSSVVIEQGKLYATAGVFPSETVYLCALDATSGAELWRTEMNDLPAQGYLLASATRLYVTTGRERPVVFDRANGERLYQVAGGGGGTYALLTGDQLLYGPGRSGEMAVFDGGEKDQLASFSGTQMIVAGGRSYLQTATELSMLDRGRFIALARERRDAKAERAVVAKQLKEQRKTAKPEDVAAWRKRLTELGDQLERIAADMRACQGWTVANRDANVLILAHDTLFAGGAHRVSAWASADGRALWKAGTDGGVYGLAVAGGCLLVSTDHGVVQCFSTTLGSTDGGHR